MDAKAVTEIRELTTDEMEAATGGLAILRVMRNLWSLSQGPLECEQDPMGTGTTVGNCMII